MVLIYCNRCFDTKEETHHKFVITSCKHVLCTGCVKISISKNFCNTCKKPCKVLPINENLPAEVKSYFDSRAVSRLLEKVDEISRFAETQNKTFVAKNFSYRDSYYKHKEGVFEMKNQFLGHDKAVLREKEIITRLRTAYKTNLITPDLFSLTSPPAGQFANSSNTKNGRNYNCPNRYFGGSVSGSSKMSS